MRGSVIKKGDRWYVKIELDVDPATGHRRQKWHSGFNTKREAERARIDLLSKFDRGEYVEPTHQTVAEYLADWFKAIEPTIRPSTFESYERNMRNHVIDHIGSIRITKVDAGVLNGLYATLLASGRKPSSRTGQGYSPEVVKMARKLRTKGLTLQETADYLRNEFTEAERLTKDTLASLLRRSELPPPPPARTGLDPRTVNYVHTILHRAFKDAVRWGRLARNPSDSADPPKVGQKTDDVQTWDTASINSFIEQSRAANDRLFGLWATLATTGMRRGEALGLRWKDVDLDKGKAHVVQTVIQIRGKVSQSEPKTVRGRRPVKLDQGTVAILREHRKRMLEERLLIGPDFIDNGFVFHQPDGSWLHPDAISDQFLRRVSAYGLDRLTVHGLRHTWATLALEQDVHPKVVQERLGHSTVAITLGIYSHVSPTLHDEAAESIGALILG
jgi:integrase